MQNVSKNPTKAVIAEIISKSEHTAAKWLKDSGTSTCTSGLPRNTNMPKLQRISLEDYNSKGIAVND